MLRPEPAGERIITYKDASDGRCVRVKGRARQEMMTVNCGRAKGKVRKRVRIRGKQW